MTVDILGTEYTIQKVSYQDDATFSSKGLSGYCSTQAKLIVYCDIDTVPAWSEDLEISKRNFEKATLRHEMVHAFLYESGLTESSHDADSWASDEEIVEWIAVQGPKIYKAWQEVDAL